MFWHAIANGGGGIGAVNHHVIARHCKRRAVRVVVFGHAHVDQELLVLRLDVSRAVEARPNPFLGYAGLSKRHPVLRDPVLPMLREFGGIEAPRRMSWQIQRGVDERHIKPGIRQAGDVGRWEVRVVMRIPGTRGGFAL